VNAEEERKTKQMAVGVDAVVVVAVVEGVAGMVVTSVDRRVTDHLSAQRDPRAVVAETETEETEIETVEIETEETEIEETEEETEIEETEIETLIAIEIETEETEIEETEIGEETGTEKTGTEIEAAEIFREEEEVAVVVVVVVGGHAERTRQGIANMVIHVDSLTSDDLLRRYSAYYSSDDTTHKNLMHFL